MMDAIAKALARTESGFSIERRKTELRALAQLQNVVLYYYFTEFSDGQARIETATRVVLGNTRDVLADFTFACCLLLVLLVQ